MSQAASLDPPAPAPRSPRGILWNQLLLAALLVSLWFAGVRWLGPWSGLIVSLVAIRQVRQASWRHLLLAISVFVHLVWQIIWMF